MLDTMDEFLSPKMAALVNAELATGERTTWVGQPVPLRYARGSIGIVLFGIPWTAFALFWIAGASQFKFPDFSTGFGFFPLFGVPFVLIGFGMLSTPYWILRKARRTAYVITDWRVLIIDGGVGKSVTVQTLEPDRLTDLRRTQYPDGSGNLIFQRPSQASNPGNGQVAETGFVAIANVKDVEDRIRDLVRKSQNPS